MIIVVGGIKGGSGKTTICTNLAVYRSKEGDKVLLIDADEQRSASDWAEHREGLGIETRWTTVRLTGTSLRNQVLKMKESYDTILIDTGGRDTTSQRSALTTADVFLTPFQPRSLDIWTLGSLKSLIEEIRQVNPTMKTYAVINRADHNGGDNKEAASILRAVDNIILVPIPIGQRKAFSNAAAEGLGVVELKSQDKKAFEEIKGLHDTIFTSK